MMDGVIRIVNFRFRIVCHLQLPIPAYSTCKVHQHDNSTMRGLASRQPIQRTRTSGTGKLNSRSFRCPVGQAIPQLPAVDTRVRALSTERSDAPSTSQRYVQASEVVDGIVLRELLQGASAANDGTGTGGAVSQGSSIASANPLASLRQSIHDLFLPAGYPHTVRLP